MFSMELTLPAHAKINLFLEVTGKRPDHYHNICTIMTQISLCDRIYLRAEQADRCMPENIRLSCSVKELPCGQDNLAWRAAEAFIRETGIPMQVTIRIEKKIPMQAGLAGGSTDAAAVLNGLNRLAGMPLSTDTLCKIGAGLGADIPFCIRGGTMLCEGIGEQLTPLLSPPALPLVIAMANGTGVSTKEAYQRLDSHSFTPTSPQNMLHALAEGSSNGICTYLFNRFSEICPASLSLCEHVKAYGAEGALLSGSGSAVFGIFRTAQNAARCAKALQEKGLFAQEASFLRRDNTD